MAESEQYHWEAYGVEKMHSLMEGFDRSWCIAGGYAIELFVGESFRPHGDIDIFLLREDQLHIQSHFQEWEMHRAALPGLESWKEGEFLKGKISDIWGREHPAAPWRFQLMLNDRDEKEWIFKRNPAIRGSLDDMFCYTSPAVPYLAPEIQLLYKAKNEIKEKDQLDFDRAIPLIEKEKLNILKEWLQIQFSSGHDWLKKITQFL
ncbi:MAG: hypothetical protein AAFR87_17965 [Bacteroidota bacterium]